MSVTVRKRDRHKTRRNIVLAARAEFASKGYAGARMEQIAERARVNKELIYHYFRGKEHLFQEVRAEQLADAEQSHAIPQNPLLDDSQPAAELFAWRFQKMLGDLEWVTLLTWEAVQTEVAPPPNEDARRATIKEAVAIIRKAQEQGRIPVDLNPRLLQLAVFALATYPLAFAQITQMTTGLSASEKRFQSAWSSFLRKLGAHLLAPSSATVPPRQAGPVRRTGRALSRTVGPRNYHPTG